MIAGRRSLSHWRDTASKLSRDFFRKIFSNNRKPTLFVVYGFLKVWESGRKKFLGQSKTVIDDNNTATIESQGEKSLYSKRLIRNVQFSKLKKM